MSPMLKNVESLVGERELARLWRAAAGQSGTKFLKELRDNKKILGVRCDVCNRVYVPPTSTCVKCFSKLDEWVELGNKGTVLTYTIVYGEEPCYIAQPPFVYGIIQLDGADTGLVHLLGEIDFEKLKIGMRVEAVFNEDRTGHPLDIKYFKPL